MLSLLLCSFALLSIGSANVNPYRNTAVIQNQVDYTPYSLLASLLDSSSELSSPAESQYQQRRYSQSAAQPYYGPVGPSYYPVADYSLPNERDESGYQMFRSGPETRFFGMKKGAAISALLSNLLKGPPGPPGPPAAAPGVAPAPAPAPAPGANVIIGDIVKLLEDLLILLNTPAGR